MDVAEEKEVESNLSLQLEPSRFNVKGTIDTARTFLTLLTLPKEYIPSRNLYESYITQEGYTMMLSILTTGEVQIYAKEAVKSSFFLRKVMSY